MRVRAKEVGGQKYSGYYNYVRRKPGDVFDLLDPEPDPKKNKHFSEKWMEKVEPATPKTPAPGEPDPRDLPTPPAAEDSIEPETISEAAERNSSGKKGGKK